jgi:uncharacterized membrane protein YphA (DoxX/SURF4 family)
MRRLRNAERRIASWMLSHGSAAARISLGTVFVWFGALKLYGMSPATELVTALVGDIVNAETFCAVLGWWEVAIGVCLIAGGRVLTRIGLVLLFAQMPGTFLPVIFLPNLVFADFPLGLTMEGQYIVKNIVLLSCALVVGGSLYERRRPVGPADLLEG